MRHVPPRPWTKRYEQSELHPGYTENDRQIQRSQVMAFFGITDASRVDAISEVHTPPLAHGRAKMRWTQPF